MSPPWRTFEMSENVIYSKDWVDFLILNYFKCIGYGILLILLFILALEWKILIHDVPPLTETRQYANHYSIYIRMN